MNTRKSITATLDVDAQKGFSPICPSELPVPGGDEIVASLNAMAAFGSVRVGSKDAHSANAPWVAADRSLTAQPTGIASAPLFWPAHCVVGTQGFELLDGLPDPITGYDYFVWKGIEPTAHPFGCAFHDVQETRSTGIIEFLRAKGIARVIVGGLAYDYCVKDSALQLARAGFEVVVLVEACRAISAETAAVASQAMIEAGVILANTISEL